MRPYTFDEISHSVRNSRVWRSFFRHGWPETSRAKALTVMNNFVLHVHPTRLPAFVTRAFLALLAPLAAYVVLLATGSGESLSVSSDAERIGLVRYDSVVFDTPTVWTLESPRAVVLVVDIFVNQA